MVAIVVLLAFFIFKKKGKATSILLFFILTTSYAGLPTQVFPAFDKTISGSFLDALHQHYLNGGFNNDHPLNDDDKNHEPDVDPRGQPSLPSSCYEVAQMSFPGSAEVAIAVKVVIQSPMTVIVQGQKIAPILIPMNMEEQRRIFLVRISCTTIITIQNTMPKVTP